MSISYKSIPESTYPILNKYILLSKKGAMRTSTIDKDKATVCINNLYTSYGEEKPKKIVFCKSPMDVIKRVKALFKKNNEKFDRDEEICNFVLGNMDTPWVAFWSFVVAERDVINKAILEANVKLEGKDKLEEIEDFSRDVKITSVLEASKELHWYLLYDGVALVSDFPEWFSLDDQDRLHSDEKPAFGYRDGSKQYSSHNVVMPKWVFEQPEKLTMKKIAKEKNAEVRRVMMNRYGREKLLSEAKLIHQDEWGNLYHIEQIKDVDGNHYAYVDVPNATPEKDGSIKRYFLRVNPVFKTAREAVASLSPIENFSPVVEA